MSEGLDRQPDALTFWVIYENPRDFPGKFVLRAQDASPQGVQPWQMCAVFGTLIEARAAVPPGLYCFPRIPGDDPVIVEMWM